VLGQDLGTQLGTQQIVLFPWYGAPQIDYQVEIQVHRFDTDEAGQSHLNATWIIKDGKTGRQLLARESSISNSVPATDVAGSQALSSDVNSLSASIAESLLALHEATAAGMQTSFVQADRVLGSEAT
jgi:uncharacterized lipoprotein YmbA